jgi:hypothetical protein
MAAVSSKRSSSVVFAYNVSLFLINTLKSVGLLLFVICYYLLLVLIIRYLLLFSYYYNF